MQSTAAELLLRSSRVAATAVSASPRSVRSSSITPRSSARVGPAAVARAFTSTPCSHPRLSLSPSAALAARLPSPQLRAQSYSSSSSPAPAQAPPSSAEANNKVTTTTTATAAATNGNALATVDAATNADDQATKNAKDASTQADAPTTKKPNFFKRFQIGLLDLTRKTPALPPSASMLKPFEASTTLSHSKYAVKFPSRVLTAINGQTVDLSEAFTRGISIVSVAFDQFGALRNASFTHEFRSQYGSNPYVNDFEILMNRMPMMRVLQPMFNRNLLAAIPQQRHGSVFNLPAVDEELAAELGIRFYTGNFIYLVDEQGLIRWQAVGKALPREVTAMIHCANTLLSTRGQHHSVTRTNGTRMLSTPSDVVAAVSAQLPPLPSAPSSRSL